MNSASASTGINHVVEVKEVCLDFPTKEGVVKALSNVDLNINAGEFVSFIGPSGCGKTTFIKNLLLEINYDIINYDAGDIRNKNIIIRICINIIQLFLFPNLLKNGIEKLSTKGDLKNFNE